MSARLVVHVPALTTEDISPDSVTGAVHRSVTAPAVRVDGREIGVRGPARRTEVPLRPGRHRVEVMVGQSYETVLVDLGRGEEAELRIAYKRDRESGDDRLYVGSKPYVDRALASDRSPAARAAGCGVGLWALSFFLFAALAGVAGRSLGLDGSQAVLWPLAAATAVGLIGGAVAALAARRPAQDPGEVATAPLRMGGGALVLPAAVGPPPDRSGIVLRVRPRPRTLNMIGFSSRLRDTRRRSYYEFYYNEPVDWVSPPRVFLDGEDLGAAWGRWWIPAGAGTHRLRVAIDGIGGCEGVGAAEEVALTVEGGVAHVEARFNFIAMAHRRELSRPELVSRWQQVMRRAGRYEDMSDQALSEPDLEFAAP
ncbi:MAG TPA: hypothetical protein VFU12_12485 [Glycomyces sp.]|nr:hypothetical protein [Glycomyces sp.]